MSLFALSDGATVVPLLPAQDFKRVGDGDAGPNTGGMGAYAPLPWLPAGTVEQVQREVLQPVVDEMARRGTPFSGLLYAGLAMTPSGPQVIEFNCRFGDPETQVVLALLETPLAQVLHACATGRLADVGPLTWRDGAAVTVVVAAEGYPASPVAGDEVRVGELPAGVAVLHAGTRVQDGRGRQRRRPGAVGDGRRRRPGRRTAAGVRGGARGVPARQPLPHRHRGGGRRGRGAGPVTAGRPGT